MVCIFHASPETRAHGFEPDLYRTWPDPVFTLSLGQWFTLLYYVKSVTPGDFYMLDLLGALD